MDDYWDNGEEWDDYWDNEEEAKAQIPPVVNFGQGNQAQGQQNEPGRNQNFRPNQPADPGQQGWGQNPADAGNRYYMNNGNFGNQHHGGRRAGYQQNPQQRVYGHQQQWYDNRQDRAYPRYQEMGGYGGARAPLPRWGYRWNPMQGNQQTRPRYDPGISLASAWEAGLSGNTLNEGDRNRYRNDLPGMQMYSNLRQQPIGGQNLNQRGQARGGTFSNPTIRQGAFARAMSQITNNPSSAAQGNGLDANVLNRNLFDQIQLALAVKMGLNGPQQIKERALYNVLTSKSARGDMKQVLQSRAEIYSDELEPK